MPDRMRKRRSVWSRSKLCHWCKCRMRDYLPHAFPRLPADAFTLDHVVPRSKGGDNTLANLVGACHACNNKRGDMDADAFRALVSA